MWPFTRSFPSWVVCGAGVRALLEWFSVSVVAKTAAVARAQTMASPEEVCLVLICRSYFQRCRASNTKATPPHTHARAHMHAHTHTCRRAQKRTHTNEHTHERTTKRTNERSRWARPEPRVTLVSHRYASINSLSVKFSHFDHKDQRAIITCDNQASKSNDDVASLLLVGKDTIHTCTC